MSLEYWLDKRKRAPVCPRCGESGNVVPVAHGEPMEDLYELARQGGVFLGGCIIFGGGHDTEWYCWDCQRKFGSRSGLDLHDFFDELQRIEVGNGDEAVALAQRLMARRLWDTFTAGEVIKRVKASAEILLKIEVLANEHGVPVRGVEKSSAFL
jgi:hypothetical protein